ncbi:uncharacterized protein LOC135202035 [Macrobrachium nipponense]|uniref:uncharacterized protein LOC135202035 n=1 Tax=Macrobrachium nipponense TaxID=159736 RepID=UPI0030C7B300
MRQQRERLFMLVSHKIDFVEVLQCWLPTFMEVKKNLIEMKAPILKKTLLKKTLLKKTLLKKTLLMMNIFIQQQEAVHQVKSLHDDSENQITEEEQENEEENEEEILNENTSPPNAEWIKVTKKAQQHGFTGKELCVTVHPSSTDNQIWPIDVYKQIITSRNLLSYTILVVS